MGMTDGRVRSAARLMGAVPPAVPQSKYGLDEFLETKYICMGLGYSNGPASKL